MYIICHKTKDFLKVNLNDNTGKDYIIETELVYCFLTYFPFFEFFIECSGKIPSKLINIYKI